MPLATREAQREYQRQWVARRRAEYLADKACARCRATEDLHVHHRDPKQKVAHAIWSWSTIRRLAELAKCEVLCRSCHEKHHALIRQRHGTTSRYKHGCRCDLCRWAKAQAQDRYRAAKKAAGSREEAQATIGTVV